MTAQGSTTMNRPHRTEQISSVFRPHGDVRVGRVRTSGLHAVGFTLIELLVVIAVIGIVAAILLPVFAKVRARARQTACLSNMSQIGLAISQYASDYDEALPPAQNGVLGVNDATWRTVIFSYVKDNKVFGCPSNPYGSVPAFDDTNPISYVANETLMTVPPVTLINPNQIEFPSLIFLIGEGSGAGWRMHTPPNNPLTNPGCIITGVGGCEYPEPRSSTDLYAGHDGYSNYLFADGHVHALKPTALCKGMDMWNLFNSNNSLPCDPALQNALAANEKYWTQTTHP